MLDLGLDDISTPRTWYLGVDRWSAHGTKAKFCYDSEGIMHILDDSLCPIAIADYAEADHIRE